MPVDASIIGGLRPVEQANPLATIGGLMQIKEAQARQALQAQQIRQSQSAVADQEQQTAQRERQNQSLAMVTDILKDPVHAAAVGKGDVSELQRRGVDPTIVQQVQKGVLENQKNQALLDKDKLALNAEHHAAIAKAMDGVLHTYGDDPELLPQVYAGTLQNLIAEGHLNKGTFPDTIKDASDIKNLLAVNGYQANINDAALARKGTESKVALTDAQAVEATGKGAEANAVANKTNLLAPLEATGKQTANEQAQKVNAGTGATGITAKENLEHQDRVVSQKTAQGHLAVDRERLNLQQQQAGFEMNGGVSAVAKGIAAGDYDATTTRRLLGKNPGLIAQIKAIDPEFTELGLDKRQDVLKEFSNSSNAKAGGQVTALNTLIHHADLYIETAEALRNGTFVPGNAIYNKVATVFGAAPPTQADLVARFFASETGKVATGGVPAEGEVNGILKNLGSNGSPEQMKKAGQTLLGIAAGRMVPLQEKVDDAKLGKLVQVIGPSGKEILTRRGFDPATMKPLGGQGGAAPTVTTQAEYDKLPVGAEFIEDGVRHRKVAR